MKTRNIFHYLYYKLNRALSKSSYGDVAWLLAACGVGPLIGLNLYSLSKILVQLGFLNTLPTVNGKIFAIATMCISALYFRKRRVEEIVSEYSGETEAQRKRGNIIVTLYVVLTFLLYPLILIIFF